MLRPLAPDPSSASPSSDLDLPSAKRKRRPALSCEQCRRRKVKCDREEPCGPCSRGRNASSCQYVPISTDISPTSVSNTPQPGLPHPNARPVLPSSNIEQTTATHAESVVEGLGESQTLHDLRDRIARIELRLSSHDTPRSLVESNHQSIESLATRLQNIEQVLAQSPPTAPHENSNGLSVLAAKPRIRADRSKIRLLGSSHYLNSLMQHFHLFHRMMAKTKSNTQNENTVEVLTLVEKCRSFRKRVKKHHYVQSQDPFPDLADSMPSREICDRLVESYLSTFDVIYRVLHTVSFQEEYNHYWERPQDTPTSFKMKLLLILALGHSVRQDAETVASTRIHISKWVFAAQWWLNGPTENSTASLEGVQVYCLLIMARQAHSIGNSGSNWTLSGSLLRFACMRGLHRDPKHFPELSFMDTQMRRRLWATVLELLLQSSLDAYMPLMLGLEEFDCEPPSNLDDSDFDGKTLVPPPSKPETVVTETSVQLLLRQSFRSRLEVIKFLNNIKQEQSYDTALRLYSELKTFSQRVELFFQPFLSVQNLSQHGPSTFHKKLLDMILWRPVLLLHCPFLLKGEGDARFHFSRKVGLESAMILLSHLGNLDASSRMIDHFDCLTMTSTGTFKGAISLDAITVLCHEILCQLNEEGLQFGPGMIATTTSVMGNICRASRSVMIQSLERVQDQLEYLVAQGDPSLKRYVFLKTALAQIRAIESDRPAEPAVREALKESLQACQNMLHHYIETSELPESPSFVLNGPPIVNNSNIPLDPMMGNQTFNFEFGPSWLLSMWDNEPQIYFQ